MMGAHLGLHLKNEQKTKFRQLRVKKMSEGQYPDHVKRAASNGAKNWLLQPILKVNKAATAKFLEKNSHQPPNTFSGKLITLL